MNISDIRDRILDGGSITADEAYGLLDIIEDGDNRQKLYEAAAEITAKLGPRKFDSCSIINARSGRCPEDCKWCAQSAAYPTAINTYPLVDHDVCMEMAERNSRAGIGRFSLVTSGRAVTGKALDTVCDYYSELSRKGDIYLCASMGLLDDEAMRRLHGSGVRRYHCNLETSRSFFPRLCSTPHSGRETNHHLACPQCRHGDMLRWHHRHGRNHASACGICPRPARDCPRKHPAQCPTPHPRHTSSCNFYYIIFKKPC